MSDFRLVKGTVKDIEHKDSPYKKGDGNEIDRPYDGLRIRVKIEGKDNTNETSGTIYPWAFPLLPKVFQSIPKIGESVFILYDADTDSQRYYIGPIISQPQFNTKCEPMDAASLLSEPSHNKPLEMISNNDDTRGAFPKSSDVAVIGRGAEDIILRYDDTYKTKASEIQLRAGIRSEPTNDPNPNMIGNIIFNGADPSYIQLKYKKGITKKSGQNADSIINMVANRINIMSNKDDNISHNLGDKNQMIQDEKMDEIMGQLHRVPLGDKLVELLEIMKGCIMHHVHPWAGMEQCGDWGGYINKLDGYDINSVLSEYVRIS